MTNPPDEDGSGNARPARAKTPEDASMEDIAKDLDPFDWEDLEHRFVQAMEERTREEQKLMEEAQKLFQVPDTIVWSIYRCSMLMSNSYFLPGCL